MSYREIPKDKILRFSATPGFKGWRDHFTEDSTTHPAKMNLNLLRWILKTYTSEGDVVLDPMAGTGSTIVLASLLGRHGIAVEYEAKFCEMINKNIKRTKRHTTFTPKGMMTCIQGDARELSKLLDESDAIITSPPYGEAQSGGGIATKGYDGPKHSPTDLVGERSYMPDKFEKGNISRLKYGEVDAVITSPPYEGSNISGGDEEARKKRLTEAGHDVKDFFGGKARGATLRHYDEVDAIITSPPYADSVKRGDEGPNASGKDSPTYDERLANSKVYSNDPSNIGNLKHRDIDSIVTSPPYEGTISGEGGGSLDQEESQSLKTMREYSEDPENIGNLKTNSYLEAMLQVYRECFKVGGKLILVTKNFIRNMQVVRLDLDTISLCEAAGFHLSDHWYFKLPTKSFWKIIYTQRYPDVPEVEYEDILVFKKT